MRNAIIVGVHRGLNEIEPLDVTQECGRAGRVGLDTRGDAYILLPESKFTTYKYWCENIPPILSTMNDPGTLAFHIISEIEQKEVNNIETLMDWYNRSLAAFQNNFLDRVDAEILLQKLEKYKVIEKDGDNYKATNLGRVASYLYFSPYTIAGWYLNFNKIFKENIVNDYSISWALSNITDNNKNFVPKEFADDVRNYRAQCNKIGLDVTDACATSGFFIYACLTNDEEVNELYKRNAKFEIERSASACEMIDDKYARWKRKGFWKSIEMRIKYEVSEDQVELCTLKGIGGERVRRLFNAGIRTIDSFKHNKDIVINTIGDKLYSKILSENGI
jgi:replicative superfamily II helicase